MDLNSTTYNPKVKYKEKWSKRRHVVLHSWEVQRVRKGRRTNDDRGSCPYSVDHGLANEWHPADPAVDLRPESKQTKHRTMSEPRARMGISERGKVAPQVKSCTSSKGSAGTSTELKQETLMCWGICTQVK